MSVRLMEQVWRHCEARPLALLLLQCIADHARDDGTGAFPAIPRIMDRTNLRRRTVIKLLGELEAAGYIEIHREQGKVSHYTVHPTGAQRARVGSVHATSEPVHLMPPTGARHDQTGAQRAPEPLEPPREPSEPQVVVVYEELYGRAPSGGKRAFLVSIEDQWDTNRAVLALRSEHAKDPDPRTICGRMVAGLKAGDMLKQTGVT